MKRTCISVISTLFVLLPWTIFPLRTQSWALETPAAQIIISVYLVLMIGGAVFSLVGYAKGKVRTVYMQICMVINMIYGIAGIALAGLMLYTALG